MSSSADFIAVKLYKQFLFKLILMAFISQANVVLADSQVSGFVSAVAGKVTSGDEFLADYPKAGVYDNDWSMSPDTSIGIQLTSDLNQNFEFTIQAVSNGATDYSVDLDWAYISYQINSELSFQAGRKRLPLYNYSDFYDLGYAYYWIRPPADNYTWQINNYNGVSLIYQPQLGEWDTLINVYFGREDSNDNELLGLLLSASVDETWKNMFGVVAELSKDWLDLRFTLMQGQLDRSINGFETASDLKQKFSGISVNFYLNELSILSEFNQYERSASDINVDTGMLSFGYQIGEITPHITQSQFKQKQNLSGGDEDHATTSVGLRWDINNTTALKIQYDKVKDKGINVPVLGDSEAISFGIDIVF